MLVEHVTMQGAAHASRYEIKPDVDALSRRERRRLDRQYRIAAKRRDRRGN